MLCVAEVGVASGCGAVPLSAGNSQHVATNMKHSEKGAIPLSLAGFPGDVTGSTAEGPLCLKA